MDRRTSLKLLASSGMSYGLLTSFRPLEMSTNEDIEYVSLLESYSRIILGSFYSNPLATVEKGTFIRCFIDQCWKEEDQLLYWKSVKMLQQYCTEKYRNPFEDIDTENQNKIVAALFDPQKNLFEADSEWAGLSRQLVLFEFFSGQKGATEVLRHLPLPGRYEGIVPLTETDTLYRH